MCAWRFVANCDKVLNEPEFLPHFHPSSLSNFFDPSKRKDGFSRRNKSAATRKVTSLIFRIPTLVLQSCEEETIRFQSCKEKKIVYNPAMRRRSFSILQRGEDHFWIFRRLFSIPRLHLTFSILQREKRISLGSQRQAYHSISRPPCIIMLKAPCPGIYKDYVLSPSHRFLLPPHHLPQTK